MLSAEDIDGLRDLYRYLYPNEAEADAQFAARLAEIVAIGEPVSRPYPTPKHHFFAPTF